MYASIELQPAVTVRLDRPSLNKLRGLALLFVKPVSINRIVRIMLQSKICLVM